MFMFVMTLGANLNCTSTQTIKSAYIDFTQKIFDIFDVLPL